MHRIWPSAALALCFCASARAQPEPRVEDLPTAAACEATTTVPARPQVESHPALFDGHTDSSRRFESCFGTYFGRQALLEHCAQAGADFNKPCPGASLDVPRRALDLAILRADAAAVRVLLNAGADLKLTWQPMHLLADACDDLHVANCREIASMLRTHGASIEESDGHNGTPLTIAWGRSRLMSLALIDMGADVNGLGKDGCTVLNHATEYGDTPDSKMLESKGAKTNGMCTFRRGAKKIGEGASILLFLPCIFGGCGH